MFDRIGRKLSAPVTDRAAQRVPRSITPPAITSFGLLAGIACAWSAAQGWLIASVFLWIVNRLADGLDGAVSRLRAPGPEGQATTSDLGGYFDLMADFVTYSAIPIGLAWHVDQRRTWISLSVLLATFYVNLGSWSILAAIQEKRRQGASSRGESTSITMPTAIIEGTETIVAYSAFLLFPHAAAMLFVLLAVLVTLSALQRIVWARRHL
jgi:phosphatidylglycerophosphate synthase